MADETAYSGLVSAVEALRDRAAEVQLVLELSDWAVANASRYPNDSDLDDFLADRREAERQLTTQIDAELDDLVGLFEPFAEMPRPSAFRSLADQLDGALAQLVVGPGGHADFVSSGNVGPNSAYDGFTSIDGLIPTWAGIAAQTFKTSFAPRIPAVVWNEFSAVEGLRGPLLGAETLWDEARKDVCALVDAARAAVDGCLGSGGDISASAALGLLGALVGVVAIPFTLGASTTVAAASFTIATSSIAVAGSAAGIVETTSVEISGEKPLDVIADLRSRLSSFNTDLLLQESRLRTSLHDLGSQLGGMVERRNPNQHPQIPDDDTVTVFDPALHGSFTMPRPDLAEVTQGNATDPVNVGRPPGL
ncbi:hypothetical protein FE634_21740 [Nocardioides dongxiaopingii]|uniref:hypothetical protein n=1 Tax=Nocardioides sp. S-1144 TaxID=2582905 RepID=UPI001161CC20|nr:hypothetical protein [Nocardioides sp. S-1144]QDH10901.1 hypothetical protein FE634_21740 [Nocardioides sp. S-1144]